MCGTRNVAGSRFCAGCGKPLGASAEPSRGAQAYTPPHLVSRILAEQAAMESRGARDGERKTITALFADIKGSVELMENVDPEEAKAIVDPALQLMMDAVHRFEGYVAQSRGDGILALFGAPIAHEDHAQRAIHAALDMQQAIKRYAEKLRLEKGPSLQIRVGLNSGEVVVRSIRKDDLHTDYVPIGHSVNLAARMESLATPGSIVVSETTKKLAEGYFHFKSLGAAKVKGVSEPVAVYEVEGVGPLRTKLEVSSQRGLTRFVGRQDEMTQLHKALSLVRSGRGQIVAVMGDPGVGKSRLVHEFKLATQSDCRVLKAFAVSHGKAYPYLPLIDVLKGYFGITLEDDEQRREKIASKIAALDHESENTLPYLYALFGILHPESPLHQMDAQIRRGRTFEALKRLFLRETKNQPLLLVVEDLHWLDAETEAFLVALGDAMATERLLLLVNYRPEYEPRWGNKTYLIQIRLDPLKEESAEEMLGAMLGDESELSPLKRMILEKSEGTPFFMEEIVRALFERGVLVRNGAVRLTKPLAEIRIPATVEGMLAARIDRLVPHEKALMQAASVIGRVFPLAVLDEVMSESDEEVRAALSRLQSEEFIYERLEGAEVQYIFKHALTRDVAYGSLLHERRAVLHEQAAQAIEAIYENRLDEHYSELAHHYSASRNIEKAVEYLGLAGCQAAERSAHAEAVHQLTTALDLLQGITESPARDRTELRLQLAVGSCLTPIKGYAAPEVEAVYRRANELCSRAGDSAGSAPVLWGLFASQLMQAKFAVALEIAERGVRVAETVGDPIVLAEAQFALGDTLFVFARYRESWTHLERSAALYDRRHHGSFVSSYGGQDVGVASLAQGAMPLWFLGYPDAARRKSEEALTLARELAHPHSLAYALSWAGALHQLRGEPDAVLERAEEAVELCDLHGFPFWLSFATFLRGWALVAGRRDAEGIELIQSGLAGWKRVSDILLPLGLSLLADAELRMDRPEDCLRSIDEALGVSERTGERDYECLLRCLRGELLLAKPTKDRVAAEESLRHALELARCQFAKSVELRTVTRLVRLLHYQGNNEEGRQMLAEICGWFTEGFDTADLKEAKALLEELS
jgi:class 3 adenylate cyclase/tetratricopeptide (TPR) repeat protein